MNEQSTIVVAMSGGVDSSVAAALLVEQGYRVIGMMLRLWSEPGSEQSNTCCTPDSMALSRRIAAKLGIPFYSLDAKEQFRNEIVQYFIDEYAAGRTPNPCVVCNRQIKWGVLMEWAHALGADYLATGHYARLRMKDDGRISLIKGIDESKDQSYMLCRLSQEDLQRSIFPLGNMTKSAVRELAHIKGLAAADRADSQDLCFLAHQDYRQFLIRNSPGVIHPGEIVDRDGQVLGKHQGLAFYTIGQRKGLGISSPVPLYVIEKDSIHNRLVVGEEQMLGADTLVAEQFHWISNNLPEEPFTASVKIRYKAPEIHALVVPHQDGKVSIQFECPLRDITPGQWVVIYQGDECLGGGVIASERSIK
ncbi:MAG TPA: tRNA 2-thiouridine(34) synthase MnmA [Anaerolineaceae bacterium]